MNNKITTKWDNGYLVSDWKLILILEVSFFPCSVGLSALLASPKLSDLTPDQTTDMCLKSISVVTSFRPWRSYLQSRGHTSSNLIYQPLLSYSQTTVVGGLWNCQFAVKKADFISAFASYSLNIQTEEVKRVMGSKGRVLFDTWYCHRTFVLWMPCSCSFLSNFLTIVIYCPPGPIRHFLEKMDTMGSFPYRHSLSFFLETSIFPLMGFIPFSFSLYFIPSLWHLTFTLDLVSHLWSSETYLGILCHQLTHPA